MPRYTVLSHTADTGIEVQGDSLGELIAHLAYGMFDLMYDSAQLPPGEPASFRVSSWSPAELAVDVLTELLFRSETEDVAYCDITVAIDGTSATLAATVRSTSRATLRGAPIKAVTYHDLAVEKRRNGTWFGRVIFDV